MGQTTWSWLVIIYLFLGGLGAGAFLTAAFFELSGWRYKRAFCPTTLSGAMISGPAVTLGTFLLILDLGAGKTEPWRMIYLFTNFESIMTWGIWILCLFIPVAFAYGLLELIEVEPILQGFLSVRLPGLLPFLRGTKWTRISGLARKIPGQRRMLAIVGSVLAVATAIYTGVLISAVGPAIPLWSQPLLPFLRIPLMPLLFLVSAVSTGLALTFDLASTIAIPNIADDVQPMPVIHITLIALENILIGLLLISALGSGGAAAASAQLVIYGPLSVIFWVGVVLLGLVLPFIIHTYALGAKRHSLALGIGSGAGVVLAGLLLRYLIVTAGIPVSL